MFNDTEKEVQQILHVSSSSHLSIVSYGVDVALSPKTFVPVWVVLGMSMEVLRTRAR
jgi:hypothetical protein